MLTATFALAAWAVAAPAGADERDFGLRFGQTLHGDIALAGNVLHTCDINDTGGPGGTCAQARAGTAPTFFNNNHAMQQVDVDVDATTFNSSTAALALPAGAQVRFAGLYWGATGAGTVGTTAPDFASRGTVKVDSPAAGGYSAATAATLDDLPSDPNLSYVAFADVTSLVAAGGAGDYTVANVQAGTGTDTEAGWSLFVVYERAAEPLRNVTVFDGFRVMTTSLPGHDTVTQTISGFRTPPVGPVNSRVGFAAYEGEVGSNGNDEGVRVNGAAVSDGLNPASDQVNGSITQLGTRVTTKNPDQVNQIASLDLDLIQANGLLAPGSSSAQLQLVASGADGWYAHALAFSTDVQQPLVKLTKSVSDVDGGALRAGDVLEYRITAANEGNDTADAVTVSDPVPAATTLTPGSILVDGAQATDAADADAGELAGGAVVGRLGTIAAGATKTLVFRVTVGRDAAVGAGIANQASADYTIPASSIHLSATSNGVSSSVTEPAPPATIAPSPAAKRVLPKPACLSIPNVTRDRIAPFRGGKVILATRQSNDPVTPLRLSVKLRGRGAIASVTETVNGRAVRAGAVPETALRIGSHRNKVVATVRLRDGRRIRVTQFLVILRCHVPSLACHRLAGGKSLSCRTSTPLGVRRVRIVATGPNGETATGSASVTRGRYTATLRSRAALPAGTYVYKHVGTTRHRGERFFMVRLFTVS
jgi:uncharacterized repeat protein (TIGR01451 family)